MTPPREIPVKWILEQIDTWVEIGKRLESGPMSAAAYRRAEHFMELVEAWKEKHEPTREPTR
jgi:hypothetical protein